MSRLGVTNKGSSRLYVNPSADRIFGGAVSDEDDENEQQPTLHP